MNRGPRRVYFIKPVGMDGPVKIGCSQSPDGRRMTLETWSPFALEIVAKIEGGMDLERRFHALFADHHERREWFRACPAIAQVVAEINAGTFCAEALPEPTFIANRTRNTRPRRPDWFSQQMSISLRVRHAQRRTGYGCPLNPYGIVKGEDALGISIVEAFLAEPVRYGRRLEYPWARAARGELAEAA